jgi:hypothetical protein
VIVGNGVLRCGGLSFAFGGEAPPLGQGFGDVIGRFSVLPMSAFPITGHRSLGHGI